MKVQDIISGPYSRTRTSLVDKWSDTIITCCSEWHMDKVEACLNNQEKLVEALKSVVKLQKDNYGNGMTTHLKLMKEVENIKTLLQEIE